MSLTNPSSLQSRAELLAKAGAAANVDGAQMLLNATIELIVENGCK